MTRKMSEPFWGTDKPPEGYTLGNYVEYYGPLGWESADYPSWSSCHKYRIELPETKTDAELIEEIKARNPEWIPPELPDRAKDVMQKWHEEWGDSDLGQPTMCRDFGLFIARKLLKEGFIK